MPPGQRPIEEWPELQFGIVPHINASEWKFRIWGLTEKERELTFEGFTSLPQVKVYADAHCVEGWSLMDNLWEGVSTSVLKELVRIQPEARFVIVHCMEDYKTNLPLNDFFAEDALFAIKHNGKLLTPEHGYPIRLVIPKLYFWKSAKWIVGIEFTRMDRSGYWESRGYHNHGDPLKEERYRD